MSQPVPVLDHVVVNVLGELDRAAEQYRRLGFQLSERGHHTLGSSNHLAIFGENYLELLGFEPGRQTERADLWKHPAGLTGLVFKTTDSLGLHADLSQKGIPVENPAEFSRPVALPDGSHDASFRVVRLGTQLVPNGRVFFCHHFTPELVWRDEWRQHPNGVTDIVEFIIAAADPQKTTELYRSIFGAQAVTAMPGGAALRAGHATVLFLTPQEVENRFGEDAAPVSADGTDRMVALTVKTRSLAKVDALLVTSGVAFEREEERIVVPHTDAEGVALAFVE
jgi:catechol 2,3-dioxygenase-like lactoylglutathione lyase family enzyme